MHSETPSPMPSLNNAVRVAETCASVSAVVPAAWSASGCETAVRMAAGPFDTAGRRGAAADPARRPAARCMRLVLGPPLTRRRVHLPPRGHVQKLLSRTERSARWTPAITRVAARKQRTDCPRRLAPDHDMLGAHHTMHLVSRAKLQQLHRTTRLQSVASASVGIGLAGRRKALREYDARVRWMLRLR